MKSTAPIQWQIGQALLPAHLTAQENFLLADSTLRHFAQGGAPQYGLTELAWDETLLHKGSVFITHFQLVLPSHNRVVAYPGNAHVLSSPVELGELPQPVVYFFVLEELEAGTDPNKLATQPNISVARRYFKLVFSGTPHLPPHLEYLLADYDIAYQGKLAIFRQDEQGAWRVTDLHIPPLLQIGKSPYLHPALNHLRARLQHYREGLQARYHHDPAPLKQYANLSHCAHGVQSALFMLENLTCMDNTPGEIAPHPYTLYSALYRLYLDISLYQEQWPEGLLMNYRHHQLHDVYQPLLDKLNTLLAGAKTQGFSSPFILREGIYSTALPTQTQPADELYFIIQLRDALPLRDDELPKISSRARLERVYDYSLNGLRLRTVSEARIHYNFGKNTQCFLIEKDQETDHLFRDDSIAFYGDPALQGRDFFIYSQK